MKLLWTLIANLPTILKLIKAVVDYAQKQQEERKLKNDLAHIAEAFANKEKDALKKVFNS